MQLPTLLTNPRILILDDALSAVDTKTERHILERLIEIRKAKTTIIIAHRISSLRHSDMIIVINNSIIAESGTHQDLLAKGGIYKDLYEKTKDCYHGRRRRIMHGGGGHGGHSSYYEDELKTKIYDQRYLQ